MVSFNPEANGPEGPGVARNRAAKISNGSYIALQDVDDEMYGDRMLLQFKALDELRKKSVEGRNTTNRRNRW